MRNAAAILMLSGALIVGGIGCASDKGSDVGQPSTEGRTSEQDGYYENESPDGRRTEQDDYENFLRQIEDAGEERFSVYWLGQNPVFEGRTFFGPSMPAFGTDTFGRVDFSYDADLDDGGGSLDVTLVSDDEWRSRPIADRVVETFEVEVLGEVATVYVIAAGTRPIVATRMIVQLGDTHVVVTANSGGSPTPGGPDSNPLVYNEAFLRVLDQLRPYPE